ncbi:MAG: hypothetical protein JW803_08850 [Endomicrobiales bacterium]|nr:hypothetical protein [Endomicrobiales bacterium]
MKRLAVLGAVIFLFWGNIQAAISTYEEAGATVFELFPFLGPSQFTQTKDWISADTYIALTSTPTKTIDEIELATGIHAFIEESPEALPQFLTRNHSRYFYTVYPEEDTQFSVIFNDPYSNPPSAGYPKVVYWPDGSSTTTSLPLEEGAAVSGGTLYSKSVSGLAQGLYWYKYVHLNANLSSEYELETSSFAVSARPASCTNHGIQNNAVVSNGKIMLRWGSPASSNSPGSHRAPSDTIAMYRLYFGTDQTNLPLLYEGTSTYYEIDSLDYNEDYYWYVVSVNIYGVESTGAVYKFTTILPIPKAFNYPNPFNPALNETTNICFTMNEAGFAEVNVFSEYGDLCWQKTVYNLPTGVNEVNYDGRDDNGQIMYNGTYVAVIKKKYATKEEKEKCRILVIK